MNAPDVTAKSNGRLIKFCRINAIAADDAGVTAVTHQAEKVAIQAPAGGDDNSP